MKRSSKSSSPPIVRIQIQFPSNPLINLFVPPLHFSFSQQLVLEQSLGGDVQHAGRLSALVVRSLVQVAHILRFLRGDALRTGATGPEVRRLQPELPQEMRRESSQQLHSIRLL